MDETSDDVLAAREALVRLAAAIESRLESEPSWQALRQLDERPAGRRPAGPGEGRSRLTARLDASVPDWRLLAGLKAAVTALDGALAKRSRAQVAGRRRTTPAANAHDEAAPGSSPRSKRTRGQRPQASVTQRPAAPASLIERIRSASDTGDTLGHDQTVEMSRGQASEEATGSLVRAVERAQKPDGERRDFIEEADVVIVPMAGSGERQSADASASLARRLEMARESEPETSEALEVSLQARFDEASVEIVILDAGDEEDDRDGSAGRPVNGKR